MNEKDLRSDVEKWAKEIGERSAQSRLVQARVSPGAAQKLTNGNYPSKPGRLMEGAILRAMGRPDQEAS